MAVMDMIAVGDSTWHSLLGEAVEIVNPAGSVVRKCTVESACGGSLLMKAQDPPGAPSLARLRNLLEFEPNDRPLLWISFPLKGGNSKNALYAVEKDFAHTSRLPDSYSLYALTQVWREATQHAAKAFDKNGNHPQSGFAKYMLTAAVGVAEQMCPELATGPRPRGDRTPLIVVVADGWNHTDEFWKEYTEFRRGLDAMMAVGQFKRAYWTWRELCFSTWVRRRRLRRRLCWHRT